METQFLRRFAAVWFALVAVLALSACQPVQPEAGTGAASPALATFTDANGLFTVQYPADWVADATSFDDDGMPMPYVALGSNQAILDASSAWEPLPEDQIGVAIILIPRALFAEAGITDDMSLEEAMPLVVMAMSADDPEMSEEMFAAAGAPELFTLANGAPAASMEAAAPTEAYLLTLADLGDGLLLMAPRIQAVGVHNDELEAQVAAVLDSFELTASADDVMAAVMENMAAMGADAEAGEAASAAPTVTFTATEYAYEAPTEIPGGLTRIELVNTGELEHGLWFVKLDEGKTIEDFLGIMATIETDPQMPDWFAFYGGLTNAPGETTAYTIDLVPGNYAYFSFSGMENEVPDVAQGMLGMLTVTEAPATDAAPPTADVHAELVDYSFVFDGALAAGPQIVQVSNTGSEPHEMILLKLAEGVTLQDALDAMMSGEMPEGEPPAVFAGGAAPMAAGLTAWYEMNLSAGEYGLICFVPSIENEGAPHLMLGMIQPLSVAAAE